MKVLVDGNNLIHAAYYVVSSKENEKVVNKTVGLFFMMMEKLKKDFNVKKLYIAWDGKEGTNWRKEILPEYKANRKNKPEIRKCIRRIFKNTNESYIQIQKIDAEADDIIYALCRCLNNHKVIVSADKDFVQIVQEGFAESVFNPVTKKYRDIPEIDNVIEKSICGDSSDNLKGVPGCGPSFLKEYVKGNKKLSKEQKDIFEKHKKIIGLKNNPSKNELVEYVDKYIFAMTVGF